MSQVLKPISTFQVLLLIMESIILFWLSVEFYLLPFFGLNKMWRHFSFTGIFRFALILVIPQYYWYLVLVEWLLEITSNSLWWTYRLISILTLMSLKYTKLQLTYVYTLIALLGLIIGLSSSDNNKVRRRYDILDEPLNSITVFLPTKYLWFSNGRLGFK